MAVNTVTIAGNLTRDPELKPMGSGSEKLQFSIAVNDRRKNRQTGDWEDYPNYFDCEVYGNRAAALARYLSKGMKVTVQGKLHQDRWKKDGENKSKVYVICDEVEFMSQGRKSKPETQDEYDGYSYSDIPF